MSDGEEAEVYTPPQKVAGNRSTRIVRFLGDAEHAFCIGKIAHAEELQENLGAGPFEIYQRIATYTWKVRDIPEVLRIALIGGGMEPQKAASLIGRYVTAADVPMGQHAALAEEVMRAAVIGIEDEPLKKDQGEGTTTEPPSPTAD